MVIFDKGEIGGEEKEKKLEILDYFFFSVLYVVWFDLWDNCFSYLFWVFSGSLYIKLCGKCIRKVLVVLRIIFEMVVL